MSSQSKEELGALKLIGRSKVGRTQEQEVRFRELQKEKRKVQDKIRAKKNYDKMYDEQKQKKKHDVKERRARLKERNCKVIPPHLSPE